MSYPQETFTQVSIHRESLIGRRRQIAFSNTLLHQLNVLKSTGRYDAFKLGWHPSYSNAPSVWPIPDHLFWDSDIAKWIEGACYFLEHEESEQISDAIQELVQMIRGAQHPDGYINIHFSVVNPGGRFTNLRDFHELYNAGHLIEAALAHNHLYGNQLLLDPILKYVDLLCTTFGSEDGQLHGYPGHPEIELALLRLHQRTGNAEHLRLARYFILERGNPKGWDGRHYYDVEADRRGDDKDKRPAYYPESRCLWYYQAHAPILQQETIEGHAVRAMYLLTAATDLTRADIGPVSQSLKEAVVRLWKNMVSRKMYVTGGIGAIAMWEGFGEDFYLPQATDEGGCYSETCAAIGVMMLAERLIQIELNGSYGDVMELCLYNAVLTSMSLDGKQFTYTNQLASSSKDLSKRQEWFTCACCPPNILRLLGQIGGYIWSHHVETVKGQNSIAIHLYISSTLKIEIDGNSVELIQESNWPFEGNINLTLRSWSPGLGLKLRIPAWAKTWTVQPECPNAEVTDGYLGIPSGWLEQNMSFTLSIPLEPRMISPHPLTNQNTVSLACGPLIYCVEDYDNPWVKDHFKTVFLEPESKVEKVEVNDSDSADRFASLSVSEGVSILDLEDAAPAPSTQTSTLHYRIRKAEAVEKLHFVPYYFRANRGGRGHMRVGLKTGDFLQAIDSKVN